MKDFKTAFFFLRLPVAISLLGHGLVRLPKLQTFSDLDGNQHGEVGYSHRFINLFQLRSAYYRSCFGYFVVNRIQDKIYAICRIGFNEYPNLRKHFH
jgi:hypothetical protein